MSRKKNIRSKQQFDAALILERSGDTPGAIKLYQKATTIDPTNTHAWNRQMILYRKSRTREQEVHLIKSVISEFQKSVETKQQDWLQANQTKADSSRELANMLGLLEPTGLPKSDDPNIEKWQSRLYLLEYRIKNARKKKVTTKNKTQKLSEPAKSATAKAKKQVTKAKPLPKTKKNPAPKPAKQDDRRTVRKI
jgi:hypothetical protein